MLLDTQSLFSDAQAITATAPSTNVIDFGVAQVPQHAKAAVHRDVGKGRPIQILVQVVADFDELTNLAIALQVSDAEAFGSGVETVYTQTVLLADLTAGKRIGPFYLPEGMDKRYARLLYTVTGTAPTTGAVTAGLVFGKANWTP